MRRSAAGNACRRPRSLDRGLVGLYDRRGAFIGVGEVHDPGEVAPRGGWFPRRPVPPAAPAERIDGA